MRSKNINYTTAIASILEKNYPFDWARLTMYYEDNIYNAIPYLLFRLDSKADVSLYDEIKQIIEKFNGNLKWTVFKCSISRKENHLLAPEILYDIEVNYTRKGINLDEKEIFSTVEYKQICEKAIEDIPNLVKHIEKYLEKKK